MTEIGIAAHIGAGKITTTKRLMQKVDEMENVVIVDEEQTNVFMQEPYPITTEYHRHFDDLEALHLITGERQTPKKFRNCVSVPVGSEKKQGRNELCACGSGKKFKKCCSIL